MKRRRRGIEIQPPKRNRKRGTKEKEKKDEECFISYVIC
jgi:hypothetical protein